MSYKKIMILGNVGAAPEIRNLPNGVIVANFSVATNDRFVKNGVKTEKTDWWRVDAFQKGDKGLVTDVIQKWVTSGQMVMIEGAPEQEEWTDKNSGEKKRGFKVRIGHPGSSLQLCGGKKGSSQPGEAGGPATTGDDSASAATSADDEEIPF